MISHYSSNRQLDVILEPETVSRLLESLRAGIIDMAYFRDLCPSARTSHRDYSQATPETTERVEQLCRKVRYTTDGQVVLRWELKIRLLNAIRLGRINLPAVFPELWAARQAVRYDWSSITHEELDFLVEAALTIP